MMLRSMGVFVLLTLTWGVSVYGAPKPVHESQVRRELRDILAAPEYNRAYTPDAFAATMNAIAEATGRFFRWLGKVLSFGSGGAGDVLSFILAWAVVLCFIALLGLLIARLLNAIGPRTGQYQEADNYELPSAVPLIREAEKLARAGDYRGAFRCAYLASISHLDEVKALRFERSRTNWEYMRDLEAKGFEAPRGHLMPLTRDFDRKFYGRESCEHSDYQRAAAAYDSVRQVKAA